MYERISFDKEKGVQEEAADKYAEDMLIPLENYQEFLSKRRFDIQSIRNFANQINRDPGIVLGRLQNDRKVGFDDWTLKTIDGKITAHYEHTVVVTDDGYEILTKI